MTKPETGIEGIPDSWSPDGQRLAFTRLDRMRDGSLWMLSLKDKTKTVSAEKPSSLISIGEPISVPGGLAELASKSPSTSPRVWDYAPDGKRIFGVADVDRRIRARPSPAVTRFRSWSTGSRI